MTSTTHSIPLNIFPEMYPYGDETPFTDFSDLNDVFAHAGMLHEVQAPWSGIEPGMGKGSGVFPQPMTNEFGFNYPVDLALDLGFGDEGISIPQIPSPQSTTTTTLTDLLRSTSHLATQRALYMTTTQPQPLSSEPPHNPIYSPSPPPDCSTPTTITSQTLSSPDDWATTPRTPIGLNKRKLEVDLALTPTKSHTSPSPLGVPPELELVASSGGVKRRRSTEPDSDSETSLSLTPLEMPDGSTRFTSNWLPVDPEGGFTIGMGEMFDPLAGVGREAFVCVGD